MEQIDVASLLTAVADLWYWLVILLILVFSSAFFSGSESALTTLYRTGGRHVDDEKLQKLVQDPDRLLSTILFGNNLLNIAASAIATMIAIETFGDYGPAIATGIMFFLILTIGELIPKTIGIRYSDRVAPTAARVVWYLSIVFYPIIRGLSLLSHKIAGGATVQQRITEEEINAILDIGAEQGVVEKDEREIIDKVFELSETYAKDVMTVRTDIIALEGSATVGTALETVAKYNNSRMPVYENDLENIIGITHVKDIVRHLEDREAPIKDFMREVYYVPESKKLDDLMQEFQQKAIQMAIVVDEHGSTAGLVTLEDILEELVGEIFDEYEVQENMIKAVGNDTFIVNGNFHIDDLSQELNYELPRGDYDTTAGFVIALFGRIPRQGDQIVFDRFLFRIEKMLKRRVKVITVRRLAATDESEKNIKGGE